MRKNHLIFISCIMLILLSAVALAACSADQDEAKEPAAASESVDTPVKITGYTDFGKGVQYFLKEGDKIAVITPSSIPDEKMIEDTMNGLKDWGYVSVKGKYVCTGKLNLDTKMWDVVLQ